VTSSFPCPLHLNVHNSLCGRAFFRQAFYLALAPPGYFPFPPFPLSLIPFPDPGLRFLAEVTASPHVSPPPYFPPPNGCLCEGVLPRVSLLRRRTCSPQSPICGHRIFSSSLVAEIPFRRRYPFLVRVFSFFPGPRLLGVFFLFPKPSDGEVGLFPFRKTRFF